MVIAVLFLAGFIISCQKEGSKDDQLTQTVSEEDATTYSEESMEAEGSFDDVEDIGMTAANEEAISGSGRIFPFLRLRARIGQCAEITVSPNDSTYPKTVTIDFGDGCIGLDGKLRRGVIILNFTGRIRHSGSVLTITLRDYYLNRAHVEGTKVISNLSENGNIKFTVQVVEGKVTLPNGRGYKYNALKYVHQTEGGATDDLSDDVYKIEGTSGTKFNNGISIGLTTETPLVKKAVCPWISDGTLKIKINNRQLSLDYGAPNNGDCDNKAMLSWNNGNGHLLISLP